jgi:hypothetical protein
MQESKVEKIICISKCVRRLQRVEGSKKESVVEAVGEEGFGGGRWEGLGAGEFGGWLAGRCENRVFQQAQATAGRSLTYCGAKSRSG